MAYNRGTMSEDKTQETIERGELGVILLGESCTIHLLADDAVPEEGLCEYQGQKAGSFFLRQRQARDLIAKLRTPSPPPETQPPRP
jgi:hypothetical protein